MLKFIFSEFCSYLFYIGEKHAILSQIMFFDSGASAFIGNEEYWSEILTKNNYWRFKVAVNKLSLYNEISFHLPGDRVFDRNFIRKLYDLLNKYIKQMRKIIVMAVDCRADYEVQVRRLCREL